MRGWLRTGSPRPRGLLLLAASLAVAGRSGADPPDPDRLPVASVPRLELTLPSLANLGSIGAESSRPWHVYWEGGTLPSPSRATPDSELRLDIETWRWEIGQLSLTGELAISPERERLCYPQCTGPGWSSMSRLRYDAGTIGPLQQVGPELRAGSGAPADAPGRTRWLLGTGLHGKF